MNPDGTPIVEDEEISTENISESDGGITTTPEEVTELLHLNPQPALKSNDDNEEEEEENDEAAKAAEEAEKAKEAEELAKTEELKAAELEKQKSNDNPENPEQPKFELEVEDVNGVKVTIQPGDDLEDVLKDFEPKNNGQIFAILDKLNELKTQKAQYEKDQATKSEEAAKAEKLASIQSGWDSEIKALQGAKRLEVTTDGKPSERVDQVFKYMNEENDKRIADGRPLVMSFEDALDKLELKETKEAEKKKAEEEKELTRKRGAIVGGSSAPVSSGAPVYKGGARNANEALKSLGILK